MSRTSAKAKSPAPPTPTPTRTPTPTPTSDAPLPVSRIPPPAAPAMEVSHRTCNFLTGDCHCHCIPKFFIGKKEVHNHGSDVKEQKKGDGKKPEEKAQEFPILTGVMKVDIWSPVTGDTVAKIFKETDGACKNLRVDPNGLIILTGAIDFNKFAENVKNSLGVDVEFVSPPRQ